MRILLPFAMLLGTIATAAEPAPALELHRVPLPIKSYRLLEMSMDDEGFIWTGSIHQAIHRYDPRNGTVETMQMPKSKVASSCNCVGRKVYILGQNYPRLVVYHRDTKKFTEIDYPAPKADVWFAVQADDPRFLYLFDRVNGVIKWDTMTDKGEIVPYPYPASMSAFGRYVSRDRAIWSFAYDLQSAQYRFQGMARFDPATDKFTEWVPKAPTDRDLKPFSDPASTFFLADTLHGRLLPFDFKAKRWCQPIDVPEFQKRFAFIGMPWPHKNRWYYSLSTYNGTDIGCDGKPYHFCNSILEFDPQSGKCHFYTLDVKDAYYQLSYILSAGDDLFVTGVNIRKSDGTMDAHGAGEAIMWQTRPLHQSKQAP